MVNILIVFNYKYVLNIYGRLRYKYYIGIYLYHRYQETLNIKANFFFFPGRANCRTLLGHHCICSKFVSDNHLVRKKEPSYTGIDWKGKTDIHSDKIINLIKGR